MRRALTSIALLALLLAWGCGGESTEEPDDSAALVRVGSKSITEQDVAKELENVPPFQRREFESPEGRQKFLDRLVEMELLYLAAMDEGLDKDDALLAEVERAQRQILMRHYYRENIEAKAQPDEEAINAYYEEHEKEFEVKERVRGRMILNENQKTARGVLKRLDQGEDFAALAKAESSDGATAAEEGDLGWFTRDGYVRSIGVNQDFTEQVFALEVGAVSEPIEVEGKGWALIKVEEKEAAGKKGLDEVRGEIARRLGPQVKEDYYKQRIEELKAQYGVEYLQASPAAEASTPEELFELAQDTKDPHKRIEYYQQIVDRFGDSEQADRAMFMVGFVYSEELQDKEKAQEAFDRFIERFPESDLVESAQYMMEAMEGKEPPFDLD